MEQFGKNSGKGNILALSPYVHTYNFSSQEAFYNMLQYHFRFAQKRDLLNDSTIVILPEYIGTWLVVAHEKRVVYSDTALEDGMKTMVLSNLVKYAANYRHSKAGDKTKGKSDPKAKGTEKGKADPSKTDPAKPKKSGTAVKPK